MNEEIFAVFVVVGVAVKILLFLAQLGSKSTKKSAVRSGNMSELELIRKMNSGTSKRKGTSSRSNYSYTDYYDSDDLGYMDCYDSDGADFMDQMIHQQNDEFNRQFMDWSMEESLKSVTPFDMGGYDTNPCNNFSIGSSFDMGGGFGMF